MPKEFWFVIVIFVLFFILVMWATHIEITEFKAECRSHGGIPVISRDDSVCYAPGTIIDIRG